MGDDYDRTFVGFDRAQEAVSPQAHLLDRLTVDTTVAPEIPAGSAMADLVIGQAFVVAVIAAMGVYFTLLAIAGGLVGVLLARRSGRR